jgi:hypothetical protein
VVSPVRTLARLAYRDFVLALPWTTVAGPPGSAGLCTIFAGRLPLRSFRDVPRLLWFVARIRRQLSHTPDVMGYAVALDIREKALWVVSAWSHRAGLARFDRTVPHRTAKVALRSATLPPTFVVWTWPADQLPVPWTETCTRVHEAANRA